MQRSIGLLLASATMFSLATARALLAGETLYNGIELPDDWPPEIRTLTNEPMPVPYLEKPPKVIPIDVGRQLFVDDFLIESTTLTRRFHAAKIHPASPVLQPDRPWEFKQSEVTNPPHAIPFSDGVWFDPRDEQFKMWYQAGFGMSTCLAISRDGIHWKKPTLDVVGGTNIVQPGTRDSATVWLDYEESDPKRRYKMMRRDNDNHRHMVHFSGDGVHWSDGLPSGNAFDRSTFFYNPFRNVWVLSLRGDSYWDGMESAAENIPRRFAKGDWIGMPRFRRYREGPDLLGLAQSWPGLPVGGDPDSFRHWHDPSMWVWADRLDAPRDDIGTTPELYNVDAVAYESLLLGLFSIWKGHPSDYPARDKINEVFAGFSRDGFHWHRPWRQPLVAVSEDPRAWNHCNVQSAGGCCLVVGDKLYFYVSGRMVRDITKRKGVSSTGLATLRRDGFASMDAGSTEGMLVTRPLQFTGNHLFVNVDNPQGSLYVEILDSQMRPLPSFVRDQCQVVRTDSTCCKVTWKSSAQLNELAGKPVRFRFYLTNGKLYSFWATPSEEGASRGYVAAGGPGFDGPRDSVGSK